MKLCSFAFAARLLVLVALVHVSASQCTSSETIVSIPFQATRNSTGALALGSSCASVAPASPAVWFALEGTGGVIYASTCNFGTQFESQILLYNVSTGSDCAQATCAAAVSSFAGQPCAVLSFPADIGYIYYLAVVGSKATDSGNFTLDVTAAPPAEYAPGIEALPAVQYLQLANDTSSSNFAFLPSNTGLPASSKGFWYSLVGHGYDISITTCNSGTQFDTALVLFALKSPCPHYYCSTFEALNDDPSSPPCSTINIVASKPDQIYLLFITGATTSSSGAFNLIITRAYPTVEAPIAAAPSAAPTEPPTVALTGASCYVATPLILNERISGITISSGQTPTALSCADYPSWAQMRGRWFRFVAPKNGTFTIHTCETNISWVDLASTNILAYRSVGSGAATCAELTSSECVQTWSSSVGKCSAYAFNATTSEVVYSYVGLSNPFTTYSETFSVIVEEGSLYQRIYYPPIELNVCSAKITDLQVANPINGQFLETNQQLLPLFVNNGAAPDAEYCGVPNTTRGNWYRVSSPTGKLTASTCFAETKANTLISVFQGSSCSSIRCIWYNVDAAVCRENAGTSVVTAYDSKMSTFTTGDIYLFISQEQQSSSAIDYRVELQLGDGDNASYTNHTTIVIGPAVGIPLTIIVLSIVFLVSWLRRRRHSSRTVVPAHSAGVHIVTTNTAPIPTPTPAPVSVISTSTTVAPATVAPQHDPVLEYEMQEQPRYNVFPGNQQPQAQPHYNVFPGLEQPQVQAPAQTQPHYNIFPGATH